MNWCSAHPINSFMVHQWTVFFPTREINTRSVFEFAYKMNCPWQFTPHPFAPPKILILHHQYFLEVVDSTGTTCWWHGLFLAQCAYICPLIYWEEGGRSVHWHLLREFKSHWMGGAALLIKEYYVKTCPRRWVFCSSTGTGRRSQSVNGGWGTVVSVSSCWGRVCSLLSFFSLSGSRRWLVESFFGL